VQFLVLLVVALGGIIAAAVLAVCGLVAVLRRTGRSQPAWLRAAALLTGAGAISMYVWGVVHVGFAVLDAEDGGTDSSPIRPCRDAGWEAARHVVGYQVSYVPLRFECRLDSGGWYAASSVPGYVNPATAVLGLTAAICGTLAAVAANHIDRPSPTPDRF
jgi:hypothetical protein